MTSDLELSCCENTVLHHYNSVPPQKSYEQPVYVYIYLSDAQFAKVLKFE